MFSGLVPGVLIYFHIKKGATIMPEVSSLLVCLMGLGIVFIGLICIVFLCKLLTVVCRILGLLEDNKAIMNQAAPAQAPAAPAAANGNEIPDRGAFIAAVSAVLAEELGSDVSAIRILSVKKL